MFPEGWFEGLIIYFLFWGAIIGLGIAGLIWLIVWLVSNINIEWIG